MRDFLYYSRLGNNSQFVESRLYAGLLGFRDDLSMINVEKTKESLLVINGFLKKVFEESFESRILFVDLDCETSVSSRHCALTTLQPFLTEVEGWSSGKLTNSKIDNRIEAICLLNVKSNNFIVQEANKLGIPIIGLLDNDSSVDLIQFPVLINDDSSEIKSVVNSLICVSILEGALLGYGLSCS